MVAAEPADLPLDAALLVRPLDAGLTVERLDAVVQAERGPPVGFDPLPAEPDHAGDGGLEIVVADLPGRHPTQHIEGVGVALEERLPPSRGADSVHGPTGVGQSQAEQRACDKLAAQPDRDLTEIDLGLPTGQVLLRNEGVRGFAPGLECGSHAGGWRRTPAPSSTTPPRPRHARPVAGRRSASRCAAASAGRRDRRATSRRSPPRTIQSGSALRWRLPGLWPRRRERGRDRAVANSVLPLERSVRQSSTGVAPDRRIELDAGACG